MLAALLSRAGSHASTDWLCTAVWGADPPASARRNIHLYVHRLRRAIGAEWIAKNASGYVIGIGDELDAVRFRKLVAAGQAELDDGDAGAARRTLRDALDLWRGGAYEEFAESVPLAAEAARLERLRLVAGEQWVAAELAAGRAGTAPASRRCRSPPPATWSPARTSSASSAGRSTRGPRRPGSARR